MNETVENEKAVTESQMSALIRAHAMYQRMMRYPHLLDNMRRLFLAALGERAILDEESARRQVVEMLQESKLPTDEETVREYVNVLIDLRFAARFDQEQIENYINLARKQAAFENLNRVVNTEGATSSQIKKVLKEFCRIPQGTLYISPSDAEGVRVALIRHFISNLLPFVGVAKNHITVRDIDEMMDHSYWNRRRSGKIGGKAAGMFLAYKIIVPRLMEKDPELERYVAIPESYYFNSGILSDFLDYNDLYSFHSQKYKSRESIEKEYRTIEHVFEKASFPPDVVDDFRKFLEQAGTHPLILRSSSLLEDNVGHAFSGKYDSVFIANQGDLESRLKEFMAGLKKVLMSTFSPSAILYRRDHDLLDFDERMSVLVQKVVGRRYGRYFFPFAAGVAFSRNAYPWTPRIVKEDGLVRIVVGLGTHAVEHSASDYPRMSPLSHPMLRPEATAEQIRKYSQKILDVINLESGGIETVSFLNLFSEIECPDLYYALSVDQEGHLSPPPFKGLEIDLARSCITFDNFFTKTRFAPLMKKILKELEQAYGRPVDVEFAWDDDRLYLLQCRSLAMAEELQKVALPEDVPPDRMLFTNHHGVSNSIVKNIEYVVYIDPRVFAQIRTIEERLDVTHVVSRLNMVLADKRYALFGPSRWGTNDLNYGVKVMYEDINRTLILGEIAFEEKGSTPEVSYGTHFFSDLVEARIVPVAIHPDEPGAIFDERFLLESPNLLTSLAPDLSHYTSLAHVIHIPACTGGRLLHVFQDGASQRGMGFFANADERRNA